MPPDKTPTLTPCICQAGVSFLAYATPPAVLFSAAGGSAAGAASVPVTHGKKHPTKVQVLHDLAVARVFIYKALDIIYGIGMCGLGETGRAMPGRFWAGGIPHLWVLPAPARTPRRLVSLQLTPLASCASRLCVEPGGHADEQRGDHIC